MINNCPDYNPLDWYWVDEDRCFSSRRNAYVGVDDAEYLAWLAAGNLPTVHPAEAESLIDILAPYGITANVPMSAGKMQNAVISSVQKLLDQTAQSRGYDGVLSACSYAPSTNPVFSSEGQACVAYRDACWAYCYEQLNLILTQQRQPPESVDSFIAELPAIVWP